MKRIIISMLVCFLSIFSIQGQIAPVQTNNSPYDFLFAGNMTVSINKSNNKMSLSIHSDNPYEDKVAMLSLGVGTKAAVQSLQNIYTAITKENAESKIGGYIFITAQTIGLAHIVHTGKLEYTAGDYIVKNFQLSDLMLQLTVRDASASFGKTKCLVEKFSNYSGITIKVNFIDFNTSKTINLLPIEHNDDVM